VIAYYIHKESNCANNPSYMISLTMHRNCNFQCTTWPCSAYNFSLKVR